MTEIKATKPVEDRLCYTGINLSAIEIDCHYHTATVNPVLSIAVHVVHAEFLSMELGTCT